MRATAGVLGPDSGRRRDPALRGVPRPRRREPGGRGARCSTRWRRCMRCRASSSSRTSSCARPTRPWTSSGASGWVSHHEALVRMLEGQPALAESPLRAGVEKLASMSDRGLLATTIAMLAQAVYAQGRLDGGRAALPDGGRRRRGRRHRDPGDLARRRGEGPRAARAPEEAESARPGGGRAGCADRLALPSRRCDARPRRGARHHCLGATSIRALCKPLFHCTRRKGNV